MTSETDDKAGILPDEKTFSNVLGQAVWLMSMDENYKHLPIATIEGRVLPAIILRQFKLYYKDKQPIGFLTWALLDQPVTEITDFSAFTGNNLEIWRSGAAIRVVDCVSPFNDAALLRDRFLQEVASSATQH